MWTKQYIRAPSIELPSLFHFKWAMSLILDIAFVDLSGHGGPRSCTWWGSWISLGKEEGVLREGGLGVGKPG